LQSITRNRILFVNLIFVERTNRSNNSSARSRNHNRGRRSSRGYRRNKSRRNSSRRRFGGGKKIPHSRYIAKSVKGYIAPSIYIEDKLFSDYNISDVIKKNIVKKGFKHPTKIQDQTIPIILQGTDILGLASTGSGKTGAFLITMITKILNDKTQKCLIIVPTRELAVQIQEEFMSLSYGTNLHSALAIGGTNINRQIKRLRRNPQFVFGTPGRLKDLYQRKVLNLGMINNIVLDEVDRMLDMGFIPDISLLISKIGKTRQTLFFSATMSSAAEKIAKTLLHDPVRVQVEKESPLKNVDQDIIKFYDRSRKIGLLKDRLKKEEFKKVLIFSRTKRGADRLSKRLQQNGLKVDSIHGDKSQNKRLRVLNSFKTNAINILIATDVAARGLDIPNVSHVINYDEPGNFKDYIHRIGRTARAGKTGSALTFVHGSGK